MEIDQKYQALLLEAMQELMYKVSLELADLKGKSLNAKRKELTKKQQRMEELQHLISNFR